jgi:hypothetical protein
MYQSINFDENVLYERLTHVFADYETIDEFLLYFNNNITFMSGSMVLQFINGNIYENSDMDIYMNVSDNDDVKQLESLVSFLNTCAYKYKNSCTIRERCSRFIDELADENDPMRDTMRTTYITSSIKTIVELKNGNSKIEIILIQADIEVFLEEYFDFDIVKNYFNRNQIFSNVNQSICCGDMITMDLNKFFNCICRSGTVSLMMGRYVKYYSRGFIHFYVGKYKLTIHKLNHLANMFNKSMRIINEQIDVNYKCIIIDIYNDNQVCNMQTYSANQYKKVELEIDYKKYAVDYLIVSELFERINFAKNLNLYIDHLNMQYMHPDSDYIKYIAEQMDTNGDVIPESNGIYYLKSDGKLTILKLE